MQGRRGATPWCDCARRHRIIPRARPPRPRRATHRVAPTLPAGGFARLSGRTERCRPFSTKQERDASPWQGEAGAQRRVRVGCVVDRRSTHSLTFHPLPRPIQGEGEESTWLGGTQCRFAHRSCTAEKRRLSLAGRGRCRAPGEGGSCGACRGDAVRRPGAIVHDGPASSRVPAHHGPAGRPTASPLQRVPVGRRVVGTTARVPWRYRRTTSRTAPLSGRPT